MEVYWYATGTHPHRETKTPPVRILGVANDWNLVGDVMWRKLRGLGGLKLEGKGRKSPPIIPDRLIREIAWMDKRLQIPRRVILKPHNSILNFKSAEAGEEKFTGSEEDLIWNDEDIGNPQIFQEEIRAITDGEADMIWTATPQARSLTLVELHEMAEDPDCPMTVEEAVLDTMDNLYLTDTAKAAFEATIPEDYRDTRVHGEFLQLVGLVYNDWNRNIHEIPVSSCGDWDNCPRVIVIDPGYANPCAVLWAVRLPGPRPRFVGYREYYQTRKTVSQVADAVVSLSSGEPVAQIIIDRESLKKNLGYQTSILEQFNQAFRDKNFRSVLTGAPLQCQRSKGGIEDGIYKAKEMLLLDETDRPGFAITDNLYHFKKELRRYERPRDKAGRAMSEKPIDKWNHLLDCWRYLAQSPMGFVEVSKAAKPSGSPAYVMFKKLDKQRRRKRNARGQRPPISIV